MSTPVTVSAEFGPLPITIETGKLAKLADGAVTVRHGDTIVVVTAVSSTSVKEGQDWFPLTVEYREKAAAVGKIPGGYLRREGRPSEKEILTCRMTDRPLRPLFPKGYFFDTQIITTLLSADGENDPDILSINGASAALMVSDIPFAGPIGAVRVTRVDGKFIANPPHSVRRQGDLDLVYVGTEREALMIEGSANQLPEADFKQALAFAQEQIQVVIRLQKELKERAGKAKRQVDIQAVRPDLLEIAYATAGSRIEAAIYAPTKSERSKAVKALKDEVKAKILEKFPTASAYEMSSAFEYLEKKAVRKSILDDGKRADGRGARDVRPLSAETGLLPRSHGSGLFSRGETQALCLVTLASVQEAQDLDGYTGGETSKRFILHYNFPPFSVGETGRVGVMNRREIGHGALAERSLYPVLPPEDQFAYAIRVSSEIMESNGSTSMASICGGTLGLMDAGVPILAPVAGISVGLISEPGENGELKRYKTITDILGSEDHYGDMDFKLAGTAKGVTGFQLDLKLAGIPLSLLNEAIDQAREARGQILDVMTKAMPESRTTLSPYAPRIETLKVNPDKIGLIIGPGGKNIKAMVAESGAQINIDDDGSVKIYASNGDSLATARRRIEEIVAVIEPGKTYQGKIVSLKEFGAFVEVLPGKDGLVHISEWDEGRVNRMEDVAKVGDEVWVKCVGVDDRGRARLSRKAAMRDRAGAS